LWRFDLHVVAAHGNPVRRVWKQLSELILARGPGLLQCRGQGLPFEITMNGIAGSGVALDAARI